MTASIESAVTNADGTEAPIVLGEVDVPEAAMTPSGRPLPVPPAQRRRAGRRLRDSLPRSAHAGFTASPSRPDPLSILEAQNETRVPELVPIRWGRMLSSPFTFFRGAAAVMASDLSTTATTGLEVQLCGDAHLLNFGLYATAERRLVFGVNDFDETLRGPWEWDLKRLAASLAVAGRGVGMNDDDARAAAEASGRAYRERLDTYANMRRLDVWYSTVDVGMIEKLFADQKRRPKHRALAHGVSVAGPRPAPHAGPAHETAQRATRKARLHDSIQALLKLTEVIDGRHRIRHDPPLIVRVDEHPDVGPQLDAIVSHYLETLPEERRYLIGTYTLSDLAMKVVGVGSVGTRCYIGLFHGDGAGEGEDPLFLQVKEALPSVLSPYLGPGPYAHHGQRVVVGQRLMQAFPDIFLGWTRAPFTARHFYIRQLRDMKGSFDVERMTPDDLACYGGLCGWSLARSHARSGDPAGISGYLGSADRFDRALGQFAVDYADQNERDYEVLRSAVASGRIEAHTGI
ncbi:MAG: DUF2252 domain-containing protein [Acidimicrobiales bacterium]